MFRIFFFYFSTGLARGLPMPVLYWVADRIADLAYLLDRPRVPALIENQRHLWNLGDDTRMAKRMARRAYRHMATYLAEFFAAPRYPPHFLAGRVRVHGQERLDAALHHGRGVIITSAHYSNWELVASMLVYLGYPVHVIANMHPNPHAKKLFLQPREHNGVQTLDVYSAGRPTYKILKRNGVVATMADRDLTGEGVPVTFFGRQVRFPQGPARFSLGGRTPVVPTFIRRREDRTYDLEFHDPIYPPECRDRRQAVAALTQQYAAVVEREVAKDPTQYTVFFPIWSGPPPRYEAAETA